MLGVPFLDRTRGLLFTCRAASILALVAISLVPHAGAQEFRVVESAPTLRDSSVALETTVTFTFTHPVDTSARYGEEGPLAFYLMGGAGLSIDSSYVSEDLMRFSFDVTHHAAADYVWILTGARSKGGEELCTPYGLTYTTRNGWGSGSVGGFGSYVVSTKSSQCSPFVAALLDSEPTADAGLAAAVALDQDAYFEIDGVREGTYWPVLLIDWERDGIIEPDWENAGLVESEIGLYNPDWDEEADSIVVTDTSEIEIEILAHGAGSVEGSELPGTARLLQNYPNPFGRSTTIAFELERPLRLSMTIHDLLGRQVARPLSGFHQTGRHEIEWTPLRLASGLYVVRLSAEDFVLSRRIISLGS